MWLIHELVEDMVEAKVAVLMDEAEGEIIPIFVRIVEEIIIQWIHVIRNMVLHQITNSSKEQQNLLIRLHPLMLKKMQLLSRLIHPILTFRFLKNSTTI